MSDITPSGYIYGRDPKQTNPFWDSGKPGETTEYVEFLTTSQVDTVKDNVKCTNYIINYLNHNETEEILNIYVPFFDEYYTKSEIDNKNYVIQSDLNNYYTKSEIDNKNFLVQSDLNNYYTKSEIDNKNYLVQSDLNNYYTKTQIETNYYNKTETTNLINSICDQKINDEIGGVINGQY